MTSRRSCVLASVCPSASQSRGSAALALLVAALMTPTPVQADEAMTLDCPSPSSADVRADIAFSPLGGTKLKHDGKLGVVWQTASGDVYYDQVLDHKWPVPPMWPSAMLVANDAAAPTLAGRTGYGEFLILWVNRSTREVEARTLDLNSGALGAVGIIGPAAPAPLDAEISRPRVAYDEAQDQFVATWVESPGGMHIAIIEARYGYAHVVDHGFFYGFNPEVAYSKALGASKVIFEIPAVSGTQSEIMWFHVSGGIFAPQGLFFTASHPVHPQLAHFEAPGSLPNFLVGYAEGTGNGQFRVEFRCLDLDDPDAQWTPDAQVALVGPYPNRDGTPGRPHVSVSPGRFDQKTDDVILTFEDAIPVGGNRPSDIRAALIENCSADVGLATVVSGSGAATTLDERLPALATDEQGDAYFVWHDGRQCSGGSGPVDVFMSRWSLGSYAGYPIYDVGQVSD